MLIHELVGISNKQIYQKLNSQLGHPIRFLLPKRKETNHNLRRPHSERPVVKTERFNNCFTNILVSNTICLPICKLKFQCFLVSKFCNSYMYDTSKSLKRIVVVVVVFVKLGIKL